MQNAGVKIPPKGIKYYLQYSKNCAKYFVFLYKGNYSDYEFYATGGLILACQRYCKYWNNRRKDGFIKKYIRCGILKGIRTEQNFKKHNKTIIHNSTDMTAIIDKELIKEKMNQQDKTILEMLYAGHTEHEIAVFFGKSRKIVKLMRDKIVYPKK
ncbi:MAG: hypothetical protein PHW12_01650 [Smithella sp.]|jgi:hypothetical protein|nr:hypothetical protein [Smithella sp.]